MLQSLMKLLGAFFVGGLESEQRPFSRREDPSEHWDLGIVDVLKQQSRSFDIAGLANIGGNLIFDVHGLTDAAELLLILQISYEFPEILKGHVRHSKFSKISPSLCWRAFQRAQDFVRQQRQILDPNSGGGLQRITDCRGNQDNGRLAYPFGAV